ncbi:hypothetical protein B1H58_10850 [Pantoea alhagi]|uniref:Filamentous haemagglutinin FhaB/tRNA nuclease CdiA-like TPS domain-containing protein n=1 Tax=Pantoea alhagi TaxID=1891675 RepID=A0A1W6B5Y7_9GAMM|nr:filamentous hemagglutinin N-terminal domain-containing protein [Pantoea alhagi]ARJ42473.1 hypothetical protein B1H58_10850 [Pantoea alhagi]
MKTNKFKFNRLCLSVMLVTGSIVTAEAAVTAQNIPGSNLNVSTNANGSQTVNINAPSASGISHNKYSRFDVNENGLVLNNSKTGSKTSVAGNIVGNHNLDKSGPARVILNEVTSSHASKLEGSLEVAGNKAHVIVANPNGITCNGCEFINTSRSTLTTGKPVFDGEELKGFKVEKGTITVNNSGWFGMMDNLSEYTDLIGRYVAVNGYVHAKNLSIAAGRNELVEITDTGIIAQNKLKETQAQNDVLVDVGALGGMYANKITVVANDKGVGVRNAGYIIANNSLNISAQGDIHNTGYGQINSAGESTLASGGKILNQGYSINASSSLNLEAQELANANQIEADTVKIKTEKTDNSGQIRGYSKLNIDTGDFENNGKIYSQPAPSSILWSGSNRGNIIINASKKFINNGTIAANHDITITADNITNSGELNAFNKINAEATTSLTNKGLITTGRTMVLSAPVLNNSGKLKSFNSPYYESRIYSPDFHNSGELDGNFKVIDEVKSAGEIVKDTNPYDNGKNGLFNVFYGS